MLIWPQVSTTDAGCYHNFLEPQKVLSSVSVSFWCLTNHPRTQQHTVNIYSYTQRNAEKLRWLFSTCVDSGVQRKRAAATQEFVIFMSKTRSCQKGRWQCGVLLKVQAQSWLTYFYPRSIDHSKLQGQAQYQWDREHTPSTEAWGIERKWSFAEQKSKG